MQVYLILSLCMMIFIPPVECKFLSSFARQARCQNPNRCAIGYTCININYVDKCKCVHQCRLSRQTGPLCGEDGRTYQHLCALRLQECKRKKLLTVKHYGKCLGICQDAKRESESGLCKLWRESNACENHPEYMKKYCALTCGFCKLHSPPSCESSKFGCCNGSSTVAATGPNDKGCIKKCVALDRRWCKMFISDCGNNVNKETMKYYCPYACRYCHPHGKQKRRKAPVVIAG